MTTMQARAAAADRAAANKAKLDEVVKRIVAAAPELDQATKDRLALLLRGAV